MTGDWLGLPWPVTLSIVDQLIRRSPVVAAVLSIASVAWVLATNWGPVVNGHPSYPIFYFAVLLVGTLLSIGLLRSGLRHRGNWLSLATSAGLLLLALLALWLSPFGAEPAALAVIDDPGGMEVTETWTELVMWPTEGDPTVGVVFYPGARVDARAYSRVFRPFVEEGSGVVLVKAPLGVAFLAAGFYETWIREHPGIDHWIVAGHSLGGVAASSAARSELIDGLLLWASFPAGDISGLESLKVVSVYGTNDAIAEPREILASAGDLPETTRFIPVQGGIHSYFGDYGLQPGDGQPGTDRATAQDEIVAASMRLMEEVQGLLP